MSDQTAAVQAAPAIRAKLSGEDWIMRAGLAVLVLFLVVGIVLPLYTMLSKGFENSDGEFIGLANFASYISNPALTYSITNSLTISIISTLITVVLAFFYAYALMRSCMPFKPIFRSLALVPLLAPSLLPAISLVYMFGNQGMFKGLLMGESIYGPIGIVMGEVFYTFPHALMILIVALSTTDARLYEAAESLGSGKRRIFFTVTLPGARYGIVSAFFVVFTLVITDFGVPKVIGGQYNVLATDVYKQVVGRLDFEMGAVVGMVLLVPALLAFVADRLVQRKQVALMSARSVPFTPKPNPGFDLGMAIYCASVAFIILSVLAVAGAASVIKFWPYDLSLTLSNYQFDLMDGGSWDSYWNSLEMAMWTAVIGTTIVFSGAYLVEKSRGMQRWRTIIHFICMIPLAVPGIVLGLAYIFFFNNPNNPLGFLYHSMGILVICTITHFYTVSHLTAVTALKQMDPEFEAVSSSLKVPFYKTFWRVTLPVCLPAILDISIYLFVNAMTTVSAVVFLYSPDTNLASVAVLNMDDAGDIAPAAAMAMTIVGTSFGVRLIHALLTWGISKKAQAWRNR